MIHFAAEVSSALWQAVPEKKKEVLYNTYCYSTFCEWVYRACDQCLLSAAHPVHLSQLR